MVSTINFPSSNPKCNLPSFMLESEKDAKMCGKSRGKTASISFTILILIIGFGLMFELYNTSKLSNKQLATEKRRLAENASEIEKAQLIGEAVTLENKFPFVMVLLIIIIMIIGIICVWLFTPSFFMNMAVQNYLVKDYERQAMERQGLSKSEAFKQQQKMFESKQQADSRIGAARITSRATRDAMRNQTDVLRDAISRDYRFH